MLSSCERTGRHTACDTVFNAGYHICSNAETYSVISEAENAHQGTKYPFCSSPHPQVCRMAFVKPHLQTPLTCPYFQHYLTRKEYFQADKRLHLHSKPCTNWGDAESRLMCHLGLCLHNTRAKTYSYPPHQNRHHTAFIWVLLQRETSSSAELKLHHWLLQMPLFFGTWFHYIKPAHWAACLGVAGRRGREALSRAGRGRNPPRSKINDSWFPGRQETQLTPKHRHSSMADKHPDDCWLCCCHRKLPHPALQQGLRAAATHALLAGFPHFAGNISGMLSESKGAASTFCFNPQHCQWTRYRREYFLWVNTASRMARDSQRSTARVLVSFY